MTVTDEQIQRVQRLEMELRRLALVGPEVLARRAKDADALRAVLDERQEREEGPCETCRFASCVEEVDLFCTQPDLIEASGAIARSSPGLIVPRTINGQPFGCRGHEPKEAQ
jgi:hypothetical protein